MKLFLFVLLFNSLLFSQGIGFNVSFAGLRGVQMDSPAIGIGILANYEFLPNLYIEGRAAYDGVAAVYKGWEIAGYFIFNGIPYFHILGGCAWHGNDGESVSNSTSYSQSDISLICMGAGIDFTKTFSLELLYHIPFNNEIMGHNREGEKIHAMNLDGVVKFTLRYWWEL